jgi:hypothetical protein
MLAEVGLQGARISWSQRFLDQVKREARSNLPQLGVRSDLVPSGDDDIVGRAVKCDLSAVHRPLPIIAAGAG